MNEDSARRDTHDDGADDYAALVRDLLQDLASTSITHLELRHEDLHVVLRRKPGAVAEQVVGAVAQPIAEVGRPESWRPIVAPLTGIFYAQPSPDEEPFVHAGSHVEPDSIVGLIESMKMFNEVTADITGTVRELILANGDLVEAGQAILYLEPGESLEGPIPSA